MKYICPAQSKNQQALGGNKKLRERILPYPFPRGWTSSISLMAAVATYSLSLNFFHHINNVGFVF